MQCKCKRKCKCNAGGGLSCAALCCTCVLCTVYCIGRHCHANRPCLTDDRTLRVARCAMHLAAAGRGCTTREAVAGSELLLRRAAAGDDGAGACICMDHPIPSHPMHLHLHMHMPGVAVGSVTADVDIRPPQQLPRLWREHGQQHQQHPTTHSLSPSPRRSVTRTLPSRSTALALTVTLSPRSKPDAARH